MTVQELLKAGEELEAAGHLFRAHAVYEKALHKDPSAWIAHLRIGNLYHQLGHPEDAITHYEKAASVSPHSPEVWHNLGNTYQDLHQPDKAEEMYGRALTEAPDFVPSLCELGTLLYKNGAVQEGIAHLEKALSLKPSDPDSLVALGQIRARQGFVDDSIPLLRQALEIKPDDWPSYSSLLFFLFFSSRLSPAEVFQDYKNWNERFARKLAPKNISWPQSKDPNRRIRLGFVSPDFKEHPVTNYLESFIAKHDPALFDVFCYSSVGNEDDTTSRFKLQRVTWVDCKSLSDADLHQRIMKDQIDILVDLSGHMAGHRLLTFARRSAPIQITQIGYPASTGLDQMDFRITDHWMDPEGSAEAFHTEQLLRLPHCAFCYQPFSQTPDPGFPPMLENGKVTFGSFNNFAKVSSEAATAWEKILNTIPDSRLVILIKGGESNRPDITRKFPSIVPERIFLQNLLPRSAYLELHLQVDILLDSFPYSGGLTTFEALWMGVPGATLASEHSSGRHGVSIYQNLGLPEFIAQDVSEYIRINTELAQNPDRLSLLRSTLREKMTHSPLMDRNAYVKELETCYRTVWQKWCQS